MSPLGDRPRQAPTRRTLVRAGAWSAPVVAAVAAAPALAASPAPDVAIRIPYPGVVYSQSPTGIAYLVSNVGQGPTTEPTTVRIAAPSSGTLELGPLPAGATSSLDGTGGYVVVLPAGIDPGQELTIGATLTAPGDGAGVWLNALLPQGTGGEPPSADGNNDATFQVIVEQSGGGLPDIAVSGLQVVDSLVTVKVCNYGALTMYGQPTLTLTMDDSTGQFANVTAPAGWTLNQSTPDTLTLTGDQPLWSGDCVPVTATYVPSVSSGTQVIFTATASADSSTDDMNPGNNSETVTYTVP